MDLLSKAEFEAGFGSHTPIYTGQTKCAPLRHVMHLQSELFILASVFLEACGDAVTIAVTIGSD